MKSKPTKKQDLDLEQDDDDVEIYFEDDIIKKLKYSEIKNPSF